MTVLFADVAGSTALGEELDPEEMRRLLARYYAVARETIHQHGGTVEKFIGDAVMAVFGLPTAHGDDPNRAVAAALAMRDRIRVDEQLSGRLAIRFGVSTGEVVASRDQSAGDFLITGDATNIAARLQQAAEPWSILVSDRTVRAAVDAFEFGDQMQVPAKGKAVPVNAREVFGPRKTRAQRRVRLPMVGRENDLAQLQLVARRAISERRPSMVSVIAPAGTGKTRLVEEFLDWLPSLAPKAVVATAQCLPYGQQLTYWPMRQVLFTLTGSNEEATPAQVREAIAAWLRGLGGRRRRTRHQAARGHDRRGRHRRRRQGPAVRRVALGAGGGSASHAPGHRVRGPALVERQPPRPRRVHHAAARRGGRADDRARATRAARPPAGLGRRAAQPPGHRTRTAR